MSFRLLQYILNRRRFVFWATLFFFAVSIIYVITSDRMYESRALLLPPLEEGGGILVAWLAQLNIPAASLPVSAGSTSAAILADILRSRRLGEYVVRALDLQERYEEDGMENTLRNLRGRTGISITTTGLIVLRVKDGDPEFAARIANGYIAGLDSINRYLEYTRAEQTRVFISGQLERYRGELSRLQGEISRFQQEHGIIHFEEQVRGAIDVAANLKLKTTMARIERDIIREFQRDDAMELMRKETEYENLNRQLEIMMEGDTSSAVFFPLGDMPALYQEYAAMERDLEVTERVYSYLLVRAGAHLNGGQPFVPEQVEMVYWFANYPADPERIAYHAAQYETDGEYLTYLIEEIQGLEDQDWPLTTQEKRCTYCPYRSLCERGERAGIFDEMDLESEMAVEFDPTSGLEIDFEQIAEIEY